ncbi:hypothetical protein FRC10_008471 [Ceratobasidium sp. 414]|nr:hypothetical protein FRC10_008471 [Ceratobasidium sp. 414]
MQPQSARLPLAVAIVDEAEPQLSPQVARLFFPQARQAVSRASAPQFPLWSTPQLQLWEAERPSWNWNVKLQRPSASVLSNGMKRLAEAAEQAEIARQERFEESERERQRMFDELEQERDRLANDRRHQVFEITESIRREVAERGRVERSAQDEGIGREIAKAVRDAVDSTNAEREALMRTIEDERLAAEDERARLLEMRDMDRALELEDHRARVHGLEEELAAAREMVEQERLDRAAAEQVRFDQLRADAEEREAINRAQLADITNALEERRAEAARWREADDLRLAEKQQRRAAKADRAETLHDLVNGIIAEREEERRRQDEE